MRFRKLSPLIVVTILINMCPLFINMDIASAATEISISTTTFASETATAVGVVLTGFDETKNYQATIKFVDTSTNADVTNGILTASAGSTSLISGYTSYSASKLGFKGTYAAVAEALSTMTWTPSADTGQISIRIGIASEPGANEFYDANSGHYYKYISTGSSWLDARTAAESATLFGLTGYLAEINTSAENNFIGGETSANNIWIGATEDPDTATNYIGASYNGSDGQKWIWKGAIQAPLPVGSGDIAQGPGASFSSWATSEPNNDSKPGQDCAVTNWIGARGRWNDLPCSALNGYLIEFGGRTGESSTAITSTLTATVDVVTSNCAAGWTSVGDLCELAVTGSGSVTLPSAASIFDVLIVGGGGGGGGVGGAPNGGNAAGGGGGEVKYFGNKSLSGTVDVTVGSGGAAGPKAANGTATPTAPGGDGGASTVVQISSSTELIARGGKGGQQGGYLPTGSAHNPSYGNGGASGSGKTGGAATWSDSFGSYSGVSTEIGGGGGGDSTAGLASGAGGAGTRPTSGLFTSNLIYYGGGGGGVDAQGGTGGGGDGGIYNRPATVGDVNTGGGGGGAGGGYNIYNDGAQGGAGIVIFRYSTVIVDIAPGAPGAPTVSPGNGKVTVTPVAPTTGGAPTSYTITASPGGRQCVVTLPATSCEITGLTNGTTYTFTSTASNGAGTSSSSVTSAGVKPRSSSSSSVNLIPSPGAPGAPTVSPGNGKVTVTPVAPTTGGAPTSYTITASPGGRQCVVTLPATSCEITGLTNGTTYTFTSTASNGAGTSSSSVTSAGVMPSVWESATTAGQNATDSPSTPQISNFQVSAGDNSLVINTNYNGSKINEPVSYFAQAFPGGNSCVTNDPNGTCTIFKLKPGIPYSIIITASNFIGDSKPLISPHKYLFSKGVLHISRSQLILKGPIANARVTKFMSQLSQGSIVTCAAFTNKTVSSSCSYLRRIKYPSVAMIISTTVKKSKNKKLVLEEFAAAA